MDLIHTLTQIYIYSPNIPNFNNNNNNNNTNDINNTLY